MCAACVCGVDDGMIIVIYIIECRCDRIIRLKGENERPIEALRLANYSEPHKWLVTRACANIHKHLLAK